MSINSPDSGPPDLPTSQPPQPPQPPQPQIPPTPPSTSQASPKSSIRVVSWGKKGSSGSSQPASTPSRQISTSPPIISSKVFRQPRPRSVRDPTISTDEPTEPSSTSQLPSNSQNSKQLTPVISSTQTKSMETSGPPETTEIADSSLTQQDLSQHQARLRALASSRRITPSSVIQQGSGSMQRTKPEIPPNALSGRRSFPRASRPPELPVLPHGINPVIANLPDRIEGTYTDDFNILEVHDIILRRLDQLRDASINEIKEKLTHEEHKLGIPQTMVDRKATLANMNKLKQRLDILTSHRDTQEYLDQVTSLIETYRSLGTTTKVVSFKTEKKSSLSQVSLRSSSTSVPSLRSSSTNVPSFRSGSSQGPTTVSGDHRTTSGSVMNVPVIPAEHSPDREAKRKLRHATITKYLEIARHYIQIDVIRETGSANICPGCQMDLTDVPKDEETGIQTCPNPHCGYEKLNLFRAPVSSETNKATTGGRNGYDDRDNFYKALMRYQGKQPNRLPDNLTKVLDDYFRSYGLPTSDLVRKMPLTERGTRGNTTRELMYRALFETGNASYYEDVNLICHIVWLWTLPDISHLEDQIMDDYDKTQKVYECIWKNRKSNLNTQYRLFKHLQLRGHKCSIDDFKMVKTREILEYHDSIWEIMTTSANLPFIRTI
jgi:hypothetical protein